MNTSTWPKPTYSWFIVFILILALTVSFIDRYILGLLIEPIKRDLQLSDTSVSLLIGLAFTIFYCLMAIPIGRMVDKFSRVKIITAGIALWSVMTALCGLSRGYWELFLARIGVGVGEASLSPAAYSIIADLFPPEKLGLPLGIYSIGVTTGAGLAFILGGIVLGLISEFESVTIPIFGEIRSWQLTFFIVGLPGILLAIIISFIKEPARQSLGNIQDDQVVPIPEVIKYVSRGWRAYTGHFVGFTFLSIIYNALIAWTPAFLGRSYGIAPQDAGPILGVLILVFGALRSGIVSGLAIFPLMILLLLSSSLKTTLILYAPIWFFGAFGFGASVAALQQITPNRMRGVVAASYLFVANLIAITFGPLSVALVTDLVFQDELLLKYSLVIVGATSALIASTILIMTLRSFTEFAESINQPIELINAPT
jgi:MFS family permease